MSRVDENREAQRLADQRRMEQQQKEKSKGDGTEFSRLVSGRQENTARTGQKAQAEAGKQAAEQGNASTALLARQGIQANRFASTLQQKGNESVSEGRAQVKGRDDESPDPRRAAGHRDADAAEGKRVQQQGDKLAAISRDDRQPGGGGSGGGGDLGGGKDGGKDGGTKDGQLATPAQPVGQAQAAQAAAPAQQAQAAAAPRIPAEVINQIVERVLVGVNKQGLSEFHIELKGNLLAGSSIHITAKDGRISARFDTPDANVRRLVKASEGELARAFERKGLKLERLEVGGP